MAELEKAVTVASTVMTAGGQVYGGISAKRSADSEADQLRRRAITRRGEAGAAAREERRQSRLKMSRAQAVVAAGGGGLADPTIVNHMAKLEAEGEYAALARLYEGEEEASGLEEGARAVKREGRAARVAGYTKGLTSIMSGVSTLRSKYGGK
jgi:hypothetical protein